MFCITQLQSVEAPTNLLVLLLTFSGSDSLSENENVFKRGIELFIGGGGKDGNSKGISEKTDVHKKLCEFYSPGQKDLRLCIEMSLYRLTSQIMFYTSSLSLFLGMSITAHPDGIKNKRHSVISAVLDLLKNGSSSKT